MKNKKVQEKIACPYIMPNEIQNPISDVQWCFFVFYTDGTTDIDFNEPTLTQRTESWEIFFKKIVRLK